VQIGAINAKDGRNLVIHEIGASRLPRR